MKNFILILIALVDIGASLLVPICLQTPSLSQGDIGVPIHIYIK